MIKRNILKRVNYHLTTIQHDKLRKLAERTGNSVAVHIRLAVDEYLKDKER